jgi:hypothetical protein
MQISDRVVKINSKEIWASEIENVVKALKNITERHE